MSGEAMSAAALSYARGRPNAAAANSALARLVFATPTSSKESDKARKAGTWAVVAQPRLALSPTIPTRNRLSINFSVVRGAKSGDHVVLVRRIGPVAPRDMLTAGARQTGGNLIHPPRHQHGHPESYTRFAVA